MSVPVTPSAQECKTVQLIEPGGTVIKPVIDPAVEEYGEMILGPGQSEVNVQFAEKKVSDSYRFEYLYVDAFGIVNPGTIQPVVELQTMYGFTVELGGAPPEEGYILRWRVIVVSFEILGGAIDAPERFYVQIPQGASVLQLSFLNLRSNQEYGFDELRVENLIDLPGQQTPIAVQVVQKALTSFQVAFNPSPPNNNYYLTARVP